jgi:hypothetical protein
MGPPERERRASMLEQNEVKAVEVSGVSQENTGNTRVKSSAGRKLSPKDLELKPNDEKIEEVMINTLKEIDVYDPKSSFKGVHPVILRDPEGDFIRDGADLIKAAKAAGLPSIKARVLLYTTTTSPLARELSKVASGNVSDYEAVLFSEKVRNIARVIDHMIELPGVFAIRKKGGAKQKGADPFDYMAKRLGLERSVLVNYSAYWKYLTDHVSDMLIEKDVQREFLEAIQASKARLIKGLKDKNTSDDEITRIVSDFVIKSLEGNNILSKLDDPGTTLLDYSKKYEITAEMAEKVATIATDLQTVATDLKALIARKAA